MLHKKNSYIYLEARAGITHRENLRIIDTLESFRISRTSFDFVQNFFKSKCVGFIFSNVAGLHLQSLLRNKHLLMYIFITPILRTPFSLKNIWCQLKWYG